MINKTLSTFATSMAQTIMLHKWSTYSLLSYWYRFQQSSKNKKFELMLIRRAKACNSSGSVVKLKIGMFAL